MSPLTCRHDISVTVQSPTSKMLRISSVWRIRQIKFQNSLKNAGILRLFYEILPDSEQLHIIDKKAHTECIRFQESVR